MSAEGAAWSLIHLIGVRCRTVGEASSNPMTDDNGVESPLSDDALATMAQAGDLPAFNTLVERYQRSVFGLCLRMLSSPPAAEDASQEAFLSAWRGLAGYRGGSFQGWILRIAGNRCRDELRKRKRRPTDSLDALIEWQGESVAPTDRDPSPERAALGSETMRAIQRGLETIPEDQRMAVILCDVQELSYEEIAAAMGTSIGTVKSRISRGRSRLRDFLLESGELDSSVGRLVGYEQEEGASPSARGEP